MVKRARVLPFSLIVFRWLTLWSPWFKQSDWLDFNPLLGDKNVIGFSDFKTELRVLD